jgi:hypothetical protein
MTGCTPRTSPEVRVALVVHPDGFLVLVMRGEEGLDDTDAGGGAAVAALGSAVTRCGACFVPLAWAWLSARSACSEVGLGFEDVRVAAAVDLDS